MKKNVLVLLLSCTFISHSVFATEPEEVVNHYADIAQAVYQDAEKSARHLNKAITQLVDNPSEKTLQSAKEAWLASRVPYQQSEVFRFGNSVVDNWEGQLNAWPLDEGLIDYVDQSSYNYELGNAGATANIIAKTELQIGNKKIDISHITPELLASLNELAGSEANVATGYHAIEFLLWGQDLNGTNPGAGNRPYTDFLQTKECTGGHCDRRAEYIQSASKLLVSDLNWMQDQWTDNGENYRSTLTEKSAQEGLRIMLFGMGSLSLGELAGERMKVALEANSPEDEHDCFSDNTHNSHYFNQKGISNVWFGSYTRIDGSLVTGPSLNDLLIKQNKAQAKQTSKAVTSANQQVKTLVDSAAQGITFDQLIASKNKQGNALVAKSIESLVLQTAEIEKAATLLGITSLNSETADHEF